MNKEETERIRIELEKIKIKHANELAYINGKTWLKVTIILGILLAVFGSLWNRIPDKYLIPSVGFAIVYFIALLGAARYALKGDFYGKPKTFQDKIWYYLFLDFLFKKEEKGIIGEYDQKIERLKSKIK